jgi:uncharacterized protein YceH (UPF0502 family)
LDEVEETLTWFIEYPHGPLVRGIPVGEGRRVESFVHLLSPAAADSPSITGASVLINLAERGNHGCTGMRIK